MIRILGADTKPIGELVFGKQLTFCWEMETTVYFGPIFTLHTFVPVVS